jgi:hypothetical protein
VPSTLHVAMTRAHSQDRARTPALVTAAAGLAAGLALASCGSAAHPSGNAAGSTSPTQAAQATTTTLGNQTLAATLTPWTLPYAVSRPVALADANGALLLGGLATGDVSTATIERVDPSNGSSSRSGSLASAVHDAAGALIGVNAFVFGGGSFNTVPTVQEWSPGSSTNAATLPQPRSDVASASLNGTVYIVGGYDGSHLAPDVLATTDGTHFSVVGQLAQPVRYPAVAAYQGAIWIIGGVLGATESSASSGQTDDIQRFDPITHHTDVVGHLGAPLGHASAFVLNSALFVAGGRSAGAAVAQIWQINATTGLATPAGSLPGPRSDSGAVVIGGAAYLLGGEVSSPNSPLSTVVQLRPSTAQ